MRISRVALALVSMLCWAVAPDARAQSEDGGGAAPPPEEAPPMPVPCPVIDSLGPSASHAFEFPPEQTSLFVAEHVAPDGSRRPGGEGVDLIVDMIVRSLRPGCTPIRLVNIIGAADFDSRGTAFEDTVSVSRMVKSLAELKQAVEAARLAAVERGEISDLSVHYAGGGIGTRFAPIRNPSSEAERRVNRFVRVRLLQVIPGPAQTGLETGTAAPSASPEDEVLE